MIERTAPESFSDSRQRRPDLASLTSGEFIAVIALGAVLIAFGTLVTVYEFKTIHEEARHIRELGLKQTEKGEEQTGTTAEGGNM